MTVTERSLRLTRSRSGVLGGVCAGLGKHFGAPAWLLRLIWIVVVLCYGTGVALYLIMWWLVPREDLVPFEPVTWEKAQDGVHRPPFERTVADRKLAGVCGGLARRWGVDPTWVRLGFLALIPVSLGLALLAYLVAAIIIPQASEKSRTNPTAL